MEKQDLWASSKISLFRSRSLGIHNLFPKYKIPFEWILSSSRNPFSMTLLNWYKRALSYWIAFIYSINVGYTIKLANIFLKLVLITPICKSSNFFKIFHWVESKTTTSTINFLLRAFATTLAFLRWYLISRS